MVNDTEPTTATPEKTRSVALDNKGRPIIQYMSDREVQIETLETMRAVADALQELSQNPMLMALMPKGMRL